MRTSARKERGRVGSPDDYAGEHFVFLVGSPRSGTTIAAETLSRHPEIAYLYEPYYLWNYRSGSGSDDEKDASDVDDATVRFIRRHCHSFWRRSGARFVIEQSPEESLMLPLIRRTLPSARFIHMVRDGYDCTHSIAEQWRMRADLVRRRNPVAIIDNAIATLGRQPFWRFRLLQLAFELRESGLSRPWRWINKSKWKGAPGWGVRIRDWETILDEKGSLVLNALQWRHVVGAVLDALADCPTEIQLEQRYEDLVAKPEPALARLQEWIGVPPRSGLGSEMHAGSVGKGRAAFTSQDLAAITPHIAPMMNRLGYDLIGVSR